MTTLDTFSCSSLFYGLGIEKKGCFFKGKGFSQSSLYIVKEMTTSGAFLAHPYSMAIRDGEEGMFLPGKGFLSTFTLCCQRNDDLRYLFLLILILWLRDGEETMFLPA